MAKKEDKKKWYEDHEEIADVVTRGQEHNLTSLSFGPFEWNMNYELLLQLAEGNQKFVDDVRAELETKDDSTGEVTPRTWQQVKVLRIPVTHMEKLEKISVVFASGVNVVQVMGPVGKDWSYTFNMGNHSIKIMSEMLKASL
jgi:hypothetical protein